MTVKCQWCRLHNHCLPHRQRPKPINRPHRVQELCESRGGRPGLSVLMRLTVSVDVKQHWTMLIGIGHSLSLICQQTSEDMKLYIIITVSSALVSGKSSSSVTLWRLRNVSDTTCKIIVFLWTPSQLATVCSPKPLLTRYCSVLRSRPTTNKTMFCSQSSAHYYWQDMLFCSPNLPYCLQDIVLQTCPTGTTRRCSPSLPHYHNKTVFSKHAPLPTRHGSPTLPLATRRCPPSLPHCHKTVFSNTVPLLTRQLLLACLSP